MSTLSTLRRRARRSACQRAAAVALAAVLFVFGGSHRAAAIDWDDAGNDPSKLWDDNGNWNPDGDPDGLAVNIGNLANAANDRTLVDRAYSIDSLTITGGADVVNSTDDGVTNDWELIVNGPTSVTGTGSSIVIYGGDPDGLDTDSLTLGSGGSVFVNSTTASGLAVVEVDNGLFDIQTGGTLSGTGRIDLDDLPGVATVLLRNDGTITANTTGPLFSAPAAGTLQLAATSANARFDWDGTFGDGILNVNGNQTLDIDVDVSTDAFSGTMNLSTGSTLDVAGAWTLGSGTINVNTAAFGLIIGGQDPNPGAAARIAGGAWTMTGGTINLEDTWDSLQFDSAVTGTGGIINNEGTMIFNGAATFGVGSDFNMTGGGASLVVNSIVNVDTPDFNLDGTGAVGNVTTINAGGNLDLDLGVGADEDFDHTINLNGGELDVTTTDNTWSLTSVGKINATGGGLPSTVNGETFEVNGDIAVTANSTLNINATTVFNSAADVVVNAGSTLDMDFATYSGGSYTGGGVFSKGTATVAANTTWAVSTVNMDSGSTTVLGGARLDVNTGSIDNAGDGIDATITVEDAGSLSLNLTGGGDVVFDGVSGKLVYNGDATPSTFLLNPANGSALRFDAGSEFRVTGEGWSLAKVKLNGGTLNIASAGEAFRMFGGSLVAGDTNEITGGTINGPGELQIATDEALRGHGTINAAIDADGDGQLIATGGTLTVNGAIQDVGTIGTSGAAGVLNVTNPWNTNVAALVVLDGGTVQGSTITNDGAGFRGQGTITARVINNSSIISTTPGVLKVDNVTNDWDGAGGGVLRATQGTLELVDNAPFVFTGTVQADSGTVFTNGFGFEFEPASQLVLSGGAYRSTASNLIGGTVTVAGGVDSTLRVAGNAVFESTSNTTLTGNLRLDNNDTIVQAGATLGGGGKLVNLATRRLTLANTANVGVQVTNDGLLEVAGGGTGRADVLDYQQSATGVVTIDVAGLGVGSFDRLITSGIAQLDGVMNVFTGVAQPLGSTIQVITATGGVLGTFDAINSLGVALGAGLEWQAFYNPNDVKLVVGLILPGDFNNDGAVNAADYTVWADNLGAATTLPGDPTPGAVSQSDYDVWVANYGSIASASSMGMAMATSVPEPTGLVLLAMVGVGVSGKRRGR